MTNPPSGEPVGNFQATTKYQGNYIEQSNPFNLTVSTSASLLINSISISNTMVSSYTDYYFYTECNTVIATSYLITVYFPNDFNLSTSAIVKGYFGIDRTVTFNIYNNNIYITQGISQYLGANNSIEFDVNGVTNPFSTQPSQGISVKITTNDGKAVCSSNGYSITATVGTLSSITITPNDTTIYTTTSYKFSFRFDSVVPYSSYIQITFPSQITIASKGYSNCYKTYQGLSSSAQCEVSGSVLTITNLFSTNYTGIISFSIDNVTNPFSCAPTNTFDISVYSYYGYLILTDDSATITATPGLLKSCTVSSLSNITGQTTSYSFLLTITHTIPSGGYIYIVLPSQISFNHANCSNSIGLSSSYACSNDNRSLTLTNGFASSLVSGTVGFTVSGITNPGTTEPSDSFVVYTKYSSYTIDYLNTNLNVTMSVPHVFNGITLISSSNVVGSLADFSFYITPFNLMYSSGMVYVIPPSQVVLPSSVLCDPLAATVSVTCTMDKGSLNAFL